VVVLRFTIVRGTTALRAQLAQEDAPSLFTAHSQSLSGKIMRDCIIFAA
jgi:hypothetical protein